MAPKATAALRPMLPADGPELAAIFRASIEELTQDDYGDDQREAWAGRADDEAAFAKRLASGLTLVATVEGIPAGFATLDGADKIGMLYVAPESARQGIATLLCGALEKLAGARGATKLTVDASDTARDFFALRGFVPTVRNMVPIGDEWLGNTTMERTLGGDRPAGPPS